MADTVIKQDTLPKVFDSEVYIKSRKAAVAKANAAAEAKAKAATK